MGQMSIVLVGYRGSGKSTIGTMLADRLAKSFVDVDLLIVERARKTIAEIFAEDGEPFFRDIESEVVKQVSTMPDQIIGLGGGTLGREINRQVIRDAGHRVIYLRCDPAELHKRIQSDLKSAATRPNLTSLGGGIEEITKMVAQREPLYRDAMHFEIDVTHLTPDEAVAQIVELL
jgi:shikimate kinase